MGNLPKTDYKIWDNRHPRDNSAYCGLCAIINIILENVALRCTATLSPPDRGPVVLSLITTYCATHDSVQIICSSSGGLTMAPLLVELPSETWHGIRPGL